MEKLLIAITDLVCLVSPEKVQAIANRVGRAEASKASDALSDLVSTPAATSVVGQLVEAWRATTISAEQLASMLLAAGHVYNKTTSQQSTELVWTGPTTPFVSTRRTEQALLQVVNAAKQTLFITSFVAYNVPAIVNGLSAAIDRKVDLSMLLELSRDHGGSITFDAIAKMKTLVPAAKLYAWRDKPDAFNSGRVHAKVAVADGRICFITSANLTGHAMEKNIEAGVLITGGGLPKHLGDHLDSLVSTGIVTRI